MPTQQTRGTVRTSKGFALFRIIFGLLFLGLGFDQYSKPYTTHLSYFTLGIGGLFVVYGLLAFFGSKSIGSKVDLETAVPSATDRLAEITRLKSSGLISDQEFEAKRQEILKDV